ncbi:MAG: CxxxxCH/CxxCH domain-containing protein [Desulfuromonadales bacterium]|nr:CxxxxCH/CxxCH domain-containing protein [Desulfuromonadales bacterium]
MRRYRAGKKNVFVAVVMALLMLLAFSSVAAQAASVLNSCTYCHGMPPNDGVRKGNPHFGSQSSAFFGNHRSHLPTAAVATDCNVCHTAVSATGFGHQNDVIVMANSLKGYSSATLRAKYDKGVFFNMTSVPNLTNATCSNVSCHFEKKTPAWGGAAYNPATDCNACHGAPPSGTAGTAVGGLAGSHARHDVYYPGTANCQKCHPNYATFSHATSAGRALKVSGYLRNPSNTLEASATYSGTGANYLPSKSGAQVFGSCATSYCHSSGQSATGTATGITYKAVAWGSAALTCAGCHVDEATDATGTGNHRVHTLSAGANFDCSKCHAGYTKTTVTPATHVNGLIELGAAGFTYSQGSGAAHSAGNGYGTCSASICHGNATVTWGGTLYSTTDQCAKCHSSTTAGAVTAANPFYSTSYPAKVTANTDPKVGAHTSHLTSTDSLSAAINCSDCHGSVLLSAVTHMNGTTNFSWSALATRNGALTPTYTAATGVCSSVYCHGASMPGGDTSGTNRAPTWNVAFLPATITAAGCGTCHGFPPSAASGHPAVTIPAGFPTTASIGTTCSCHSNINTAGNSYANIFIDKTQHINGTLEVIASGACDACHGYPPVSVGIVGVHNNWSSARVEDYQGGGGAHSIQSHVSKLAKASEGFSNCSKCHDAADHQMSPIAFTPSQNIKVKVNQRYRFEAAKQTRYSSNRLNATSHLTGTCSNSSCHYGATPKWDPAH